MNYTKKFLIGLFLITLNSAIYSQEVNNIKAEPSQSNVVITYDLTANAECAISLYYSDDKEVTWKGPLKNVSGDVGSAQKSGNGKKIVWDAASELGTVEGFLQFKIVANYLSGSTEPSLQSKLQQKIITVEQQKRNAKLEAMRKKKNIWLIPMLATAGGGVYAYLQTGTLYEEYKVATTDAAKIRGQVQTMYLLYPIAFAATGFSLLEFIIQSGKYSREKSKKVTYGPIYVPKGLGMSLSVRL